MRVLGVDPGTGRLGWAIVEKNHRQESLIACDCIETPTHTDLPQRLALIFKTLNSAIKKYRPDQAAVEDLFFARNQKTVISVAAARGVVLLACHLADLPIKNYTPLQIKSSLTGYGNADKKQVQYMVAQILKVKNLPKLDDTVDAIAVALTHLSFHGARISL